MKLLKLPKLSLYNIVFMEERDANRNVLSADRIGVLIL